MSRAPWATLTAVLAAAWPAAAGAQTAPETGPSFSYVLDVFGNPSGGFRQDVTAVNQATLGYTAELAEGWSATGAVTATFGEDLSEQAIGDAQGVQGASAGGDALWLYQAFVTRTFASGSVSLGRLSSGDAFGSVGTMEDEFVNSAFSSNGGAISLNAGRLPAPASSWGILADSGASGGPRVRGGLFLSDQAEANADRPRSLRFRPDNGVLGFGEIAWPGGDRWEVGAGAWADSARFDAFDGRRVRGNAGGYVWATGRLTGSPESRRVEGFAMLQVAPRESRSLQPLAVQAGLSVFGVMASRPADALNLAVASGGFSDRSGLDGAETVLELNYRYVLNEAVVIRPDVQYVFNPGGLYDDALVLGVQLEFGL